MLAGVVTMLEGDGGDETLQQAYDNLVALLSAQEAYETALGTFQAAEAVLRTAQAAMAESVVANDNRPIIIEIDGNFYTAVTGGSGLPSAVLTSLATAEE